MNAALDINRRGIAYEKQGNYSAAIEQYQKAANLGAPEGKVNLARFYYSGVGLPKNPGYAVQLAQEPARLGIPSAQYLVGHALFFGNGVGQDKQNAITWLQSAANNGSPEAIAFLNKNGIRHYGATSQPYVRQFGMTSQPHVLNSGYQDYSAPFINYVAPYVDEAYRLAQERQRLQQQQRKAYYNQQRSTPSYSAPRQDAAPTPAVRQHLALHQVPQPSAPAHIEDAPDKL